jgi:aspartate racemase
MHIGLIVGIGPAATDYYYRQLIAASARAGKDLELTMAHADTPTLLRHQAQGNAQAQVDIYRRLTERLQRAGIARVAVTSIAGHFCIDAFKAVSPVPVIDLLDGTDLALVFGKGVEPGFEVLDCAEAHAAAIAIAVLKGSAPG